MLVQIGRGRDVVLPSGNAAIREWPASQLAGRFLLVPAAEINQSQVPAVGVTGLQESHMDRLLTVLTSTMIVGGVTMITLAIVL